MRRVMRRPIVGVCSTGLLWAASGCHLGHLRLYRMDGETMEPTVRNGRLYVVDTSYYKSHPVHDGELVAFRYEGQLLVKRILATSGETIEGEQGGVVRDGTLVREPYLMRPDVSQPDEFATFPARRMGAGELFLAGDNRLHSLDSRSSEYGSVHVSDVVGRVVLDQER